MEHGKKVPQSPDSLASTRRFVLAPKAAPPTVDGRAEEALLQAQAGHADGELRRLAGEREVLARTMRGMVARQTAVLSRLHAIGLERETVEREHAAVHLELASLAGKSRGSVP